MDINHAKRVKTSDYGNGLYAAIDIKPGDIILRIKNPFLFIVENQALDRVCETCLAEAGEDVELQPCINCGVAKFCSTACQEAALMKSGGLHLNECAILKKKQLDQSGSDISPANFNFACGYSGCSNVGPVVLKTPYCSSRCQELDHAPRKKVEKTQETKISLENGKILPTAIRATIELLSRGSDTYGISASLLSHGDQIRQDEKKWSDINIQASAAIFYSGKPSEYFTPAIEYLCWLSTNAFRVESNVGHGPIGLCLDPLLAATNHQCHPNAAITFNGRCATLRALSPIAKDEQVFISYIDGSQRSEIRKAALKDSWFFECTCNRCTNPKSVYTYILSNDVEITTKMETLTPSKGIHDFATSRAKNEISDMILIFSSLHVIRHIEAANSTKTDREMNKRLCSLKRNVSSLYDLIVLEHYAQQPLPTILNEIYLIYLEKQEYISALFILVHLITQVDPFIYPSPYHPQRLTRIVSLHRLLKLEELVSPENSQTLWQFCIDHDIPTDILCNIDWFATSQMIAYTLRELGNKCWGQDSVLMEDIKRDIYDLEMISAQRGDGKFGKALINWGNGGSPSCAESRKLGLELRVVADWVWNVVGLSRKDIIADRDARSLSNMPRLNIDDAGV